MERVVIVAHRRFNRANASLSVWRSQGEREFRESRLSESRIALSVFMTPSHPVCRCGDVFTELFARGTRFLLYFSIRQISYVRTSASEESLKVQLWIRVWRDSWKMRIPASTNFQNGSLIRLRIRLTFVFLCEHNFSVRAVGLSLKLNHRLKHWQNIIEDQ